MALNKILQDEQGKTTEEINLILQKYKKVLLIVDERGNNKYISSGDYRKYKYIELLKSLNDCNNVIVQANRFNFLSWQGLINMNMFDRIVIRIDTLKMEFVDAFKFFYLSKQIFDSQKPVLTIYVSNIVSDNLPVYFQTVKEIHETVSNIECVTIKPHEDQNIVDLIKIKRLIKTRSSLDEKYQKLYELIEKHEKIDLKTASNFVKKILNASHFAKIENENEDFKNAKRLSIFYKKKEILNKLLLMGYVVVVSNTPVFTTEVHNLIQFCEKDLNFIKDVSTVSIFVLWEDLNDEMKMKCKELYNWNFKHFLFFKTGDLFPLDFLKLTFKRNQYNLKEFTNYIKINNPALNTKYASLPKEYSIQFLEHTMHLITKLFYDNFLFLLNINLSLKRSFESLEEKKFCCMLEVPELADHEIFKKKYKSKKSLQKKDANKDASFLFLSEMVKNGFLDSNLLPVKQKFIDENKFYHKMIKQIYNLSYENEFDLRTKIETIKESFEDSHKFKKFYTKDIREKVEEKVDIDTILRKQAKCLMNFSDEIFFYQFADSNLGIGTLKSFDGDAYYKNVKVILKKKINLTEQQKHLLLYFQSIFFGINFKRMNMLQTNSRKYFYYVLPLKDQEIDFYYINVTLKNFFLGSVLDIQDDTILRNFLLFNPVTRTFHEYVGQCDIKLENKITYEKYKKAFVKKHKSLDLSYFGSTSKSREISENEISDKTFFEYFTKLYGMEPSRFDTDKNLIIEASAYSSRNKQKQPEVHLSEYLYVTSIKKSIKNDYRRFIEFFDIFETLSLAEEFKERHSLDVSISNIALAFTPKCIIEDVINLGYERLEFIGDSVLKFTITKFLFTECGFSLNTLVSTKDSLICNNYLYKIGVNLGLKEYFSFTKYNENLFQPPFIYEMVKDLKIVEILGIENIFRNSNQYNFVFEHLKKKVKNDEVEFGRKVYADIVESLIGVHYVEQGFDAAWKYIQNIGILNLLSDRQKSKNLKIDLQGAYIMCDYEGILSAESISMVEAIINYKFKNKGYVEKAMIHPSFKNNMFGSERFQKLELVGDCFLDIKVSDYIYNRYKKADPCALHTHRKSLVNNHTFAIILFKTGLVNLAKTGLNEQTRDVQNNRVSKCYSDIFESLAGAVVLDADFKFEQTKGFFEKILYFMIENSYEC